MKPEEVAKSPAAYAFSLWPFRRELGTVTNKRYFMEAATWDDFTATGKVTPAVLTIQEDKRGHTFDLGNDQFRFAPLSAAKILIGMLGDDGHRQDKAGVGWSDGPTPTKDEVATVRSAMENRMRDAVTEADAEFSRHHDIKQITTYAKMAAHYFGLERQWNPSVETRATKACPECGETILGVATTCKHCGAKWGTPPPSTDKGRTSARA